MFSIVLFIDIFCILQRRRSNNQCIIIAHIIIFITDLTTVCIRFPFATFVEEFVQLLCETVDLFVGVVAIIDELIDLGLHRDVLCCLVLKFVVQSVDDGFAFEGVADLAQNLFDHVDRVAGEVFGSVEGVILEDVVELSDEVTFDGGGIDARDVEVQHRAARVAVEPFEFVLGGAPYFVDVFVLGDGLACLEQIDRFIHALQKEVYEENAEVIKFYYRQKIDRMQGGFWHQYTQTAQATHSQPTTNNQQANLR